LPQINILARSIANIGDVDGDGVVDIAVGNDSRWTLMGGLGKRGCLYICF
jgi:hypothetical protein